MIKNQHKYFKVMVPHMNIDDIIEVTVTKVEPGYVKFDHFGRDATLQITELTWRTGRVDPNDYVSVGEVIRVKVLKIIDDLFSVSMREASLGGNPWNGAFKVGDQYYAPVVAKTDYGYFFQLTYFCQALLKVENASMQYQLGDRIELQISEVCSERHRVEVTE